MNVKLLKKIIKKLEAIPEDKWCTGLFLDTETGKRCVLGHFLPKSIIHATTIKNNVGVWAYLAELPEWPILGLMHQAFDDKDIVRVNNGDDHDYKQATPKARVMAYLNDLLKQTQ